MSQRIIKRKALVNIQPLHAASRLSELGMDPLRAAVDNVRAMELQLVMMRQLPRRSLTNEVNLQGLINKAIMGLVPYGYLTQDQADKRIDALKEKSKGFGESDENAIQIVLTGIAGPADSGDASVEVSLNTPSETSGCSTSESVEPATPELTFVPDESIPEELRGMHYTDRVDIQAGLAVYADENTGEVKDFTVSGMESVATSVDSTGLIRDDDLPDGLGSDGLTAEGPGTGGSF